MLSHGLIDRFSKIANEAILMVNSCVDSGDLTGKVNYVSIFAKSEVEFKSINREITQNGKIFDMQESGNYFQLAEGIVTSAGIVDICRVRAYDQDHFEEGYLDFEVVNYQKFKDKYLRQNNFLLLELPHVELLELKIIKYNVRAYFPNGF